MSEQIKLQRYLELTDELFSLFKETVKEVSHRLQTQGQKFSFSERVLIGLAMKMYHTFECLVEDVKRERSEAMHHLKTLVESFIYLFWVGRENDDKKARLVLAKSYKKKIVFFEKNPDHPNQTEYIKEWEKGFNDLIQNIKDEWMNFKDKSIETIAQEVGLEPYYQRAYRLACEPAHITDLLEYMPQKEGLISIGRIKLSILWAFVALDYGYHIMLDLLQAASDFYNLDFDDIIGKLRKRIDDVRGDKGITA
jgi:hypothetical protein